MSALHLFRTAFKAMGGPCEIQLYAVDETTAAQVAQQALMTVKRLEQKYSRYRDDSLTTRINRSAGQVQGIEVDDETAALLDYAAVCFEQSDGLFDITAGVLRRAWQFQSARLPGPAQIEALLPLVGWDKVHWQRPLLSLPYRGMEVDFGGIVKEYTADAVAMLCQQQNIEHGLVDLGGDLRVIGTHPDNQPWQVGIRHPRQPEQALAKLALYRGGLASSGDYERCMIVDGRRYSHLLNPHNGYPPENGLAAVSVVAEQCLIAGTAATVAMLKETHAGKLWLDGLGLPNLRIEQDGTVSGTLAA